MSIVTPIAASPEKTPQPSDPAAPRLRCQWERVQNIADELLILTTRQHEESPDYQPYNPDWSRYFAMDRAGSCAVWTARTPANVLAGYMVWLTTRGLHCADKIFAVGDLAFLALEWRDGMRGYKFLKSGIDAIAAACHPDIIHIETNCLYKDGRMGMLLARLGFRKIGEVYERRNYGDNPIPVLNSRGPVERN